jgi:hypothetical protein
MPLAVSICDTFAELILLRNIQVVEIDAIQQSFLQYLP